MGLKTAKWIFLFMVLEASTEACSNNASAHWDSIDEKHYASEAWLRRYKSRKTNLTITLMQNDSPIVLSETVLVTEDLSDDGTPHALEHLIFQGSKYWPYKEVLDLLAERNFAGGTNAATRQDHTTYLLEIAGAEGFLNVLPVYLDHIFFPSLKKDAFITEVHHIDGEGNDAGTVYSEMQGYPRVILNDVAGLLFPEPNGYKINQGGSVANLRSSITNEKIIKYHNKFYHSSNAELIIAGSIDINDIFKSLSEFEDRLVVENKTWSTDGWDGAFVKDYKMITDDVNKVVLVPGELDEKGTVAFGWRLPFKYRENVERIHALNIMMKYLFDPPAGLFYKTFVKSTNGLASYVYSEIPDYVDPFVMLEFGHVETESIGQLEPLMNSTFAEFSEEDMDIDRLKIFIQRHDEQTRYSLENSPNSIFEGERVSFVTGADWDKNYYDIAERFLDKTEDYWKQVIRKTFNGPRAMVKHRPCPAHTKLEAILDQERLAKRREELGEEGLLALEKDLQNAVSSPVMPPQVVAEAFPRPDASKLTFLPIKSYSKGGICSHKVGNLSEVPFKFQFDDVQSKFVRLSIAFDLESVTNPEDYALLDLINKVWLESPIKVNDTFTMDATEVEKIRLLDTLTQKSYLGDSRIHFDTDTSIDKYEEGIKIKQLTIFKTQPSLQLIRKTISHFMYRFPQIKRYFREVLPTLLNSMLLRREDPTSITSNIVKTYRFYQHILEQIEKDPEKFRKKVDDLLAKVMTPNNAKAYVAADVNVMAKKYEKETILAWKNFFPSSSNFDKSSIDNAIMHDNANRKGKIRERRNPTVRHAIANTPGTELCHLKQVINLRKDQLSQLTLDPDLEVALAYLSDELNSKIRGAGLAYGASAYSDVRLGTLTVGLFMSSNLMGSYDMLRDILGNMTLPFCSANLNENQIDSCIGTSIFRTVESEGTLADLTNLSKWAFFEGIPDGVKSNREYIKRLQDVSVWDVSKAARFYFEDFKHQDRSYLVATCGPSDIQPAAKHLKEKWGFKDLVVIEDLENSFVAED